MQDKGQNPYGFNPKTGYFLDKITALEWQYLELIYAESPSYNPIKLPEAFFCKNIFDTKIVRLKGKTNLPKTKIPAIKPGFFISISCLFILPG
jgi:hypothetical protein